MPRSLKAGILIFISLVAIVTISHRFFASSIPHSSAASIIIQNFYRDYLSINRHQNQASLPYSKSFNELLALNSKTCIEKAGDDICGWGADGDIYLDSQEIDPNLKFENSGFKASEPKPGKIKVRFNVYPSIKDESSFYTKELIFTMIQENGQWVVDNIIYPTSTARNQLQREIDQYLKKD